MTDLLFDLGRAMRRAREAAGLSLRAVRTLSANRFKPSAVGAYERGERSISLERFCELCSLYGVSAGELLTAVLTPGTSDGDVKIIRAPSSEPLERTIVLEPSHPVSP